MRACVRTRSICSKCTRSASVRAKISLTSAMLCTCRQFRAVGGLGVQCARPWLKLSASKRCWHGAVAAGDSGREAVAMDVNDRPGPADARSRFGPSA